MKRFRSSDPRWLVAFLAGFLAAMLYFQAGSARARPAAPRSTPRSIQAPKKSRAAAAFQIAQWQGASPIPVSPEKETVSTI